MKFEGIFYPVSSSSYSLEIMANFDLILNSDLGC